MIKNFEEINNDYIYIDFKEHIYKKSDLDLLHSAGVLGNSQLTFGLFYYDKLIDNSIFYNFDGDDNINVQ